MKADVKKLPKSQVSVTITVEPEEYKKYVDGAIRRFKDEVEIKGFRKGHAPEDEVVKKVGIMALYQEAIQRIIPAFFVEATKEHKLETVGQPDVNVEKLAPDNEIQFTVTTSLLPEVKLPDFSKIKVEKKPVEIGEKEVTDVLEEVQKGRAKEVAKEGVATTDDKIVVDMHMLLDNVPIEGGDAMNYGIYLNEDHYVPGMTKELVGLKKGDEKEFDLEFPKDHYQKNLAGKKVHFKIAVTDVFERELPKLDDEFAKGLGQESMDKLKELIKNNLIQEGEEKEKQRYEAALLDELVAKTTYTELPEVIVKAEKEKMIYELKRSLQRAGIPLEKYLQDLKKTEDDLRTEWEDEAQKRAQAALFSREFAVEHKIEVSDEEIKKEQELILAAYPDDEEVAKNINDQSVLHSLATVLQNRKVMEEVKKRVV